MLMQALIISLTLLISMVNSHSDCAAPPEVATNNQRNIETVKTVYAAFGKGDIDTIISKLADDVVWGYERSSDRIDFSRELRGKESVRRFFAALMDKEFPRFEPNSFASGEDIVSNLVSMDVRHQKTGKTASGNDAHHWKFNKQGQIIRYLAFQDEPKWRNLFEYGVTQYEVEALAQTWFKHLDLRQLDSLSEHVTPTYTMIGLGPKPLNFIEWKKAIQELYDGFPDVRFIVDDVIATTSDFAVYHHAVGKQTATYMGIAPTYKSVYVSGFCHFKLEKLKVFHVKCVIDMMSLLGQLGKM